ncbi:MAG: ribose-5-phosphate isomerase, partial [Spirochaetota bacterium]
EHMFSVEFGCGYPEHRKEPQREARRTLETISQITHKAFAEIMDSLPEEVVVPALSYPGMEKLIAVDAIQDTALKNALVKWYRSIS